MQAGKEIMNGFRYRLKALGRILGTIFGSLTISWKPPQWMRSLQGDRGALPELAASVREFGNRRLRPLVRRTAVIAPVSLVLVAVIVLYAVGQVGVIRVSGSEPGLTRLEDVLRPDPLHLYFSGSAAQLSAVGKVVEKGITMSPSLPGEWKWINDRTLLFIPKADWAVGQKYTVKLDRSLFPEQIKLSDYSYTFKTPPFRAELVSFMFYQDPEDPKVKKVVATVRFTHPVDTASFEKRVRMRRSDQKTGFLGFGAESWPFTVSYDKYRGEAYIHSKPMDIPEKDLAMSLTIDSGSRARPKDAFKRLPVVTQEVPGKTPRT